MTNEDYIEIDPEITYTFTITEQVKPDYSMSPRILEWLHDNIAGLVDDDNNNIFGKVNYGFNESVIKTFGKKPVCDVYINKVEYGSDFDAHTPVKVHSIILFYMKGANNATYFKASQLHDLIMQELLTNEDFQRLDDVVSNTYITNSEIRNQTMRGGYGVMGAFELKHDLY